MKGEVMGDVYRELSRTDWQKDADPPGKWPGVERVSMGALQRIADALEGIAGCDLLKELGKARNEAMRFKDELYRSRAYHKETREALASTLRRESALRGVITRRKNERAAAIDAIRLMIRRYESREHRNNGLRGGLRMALNILEGRDA